MWDSIEDKQGNKFSIEEWVNGDMTICGFFSGTLTGVHDWIYANLGYGNQIKTIKIIKTGQILTIGDKVEFVKPLRVYQGNFSEGTIKRFYIDSYSKYVGAFFDTVGKAELYDIKSVILKT